MKPTDALDVLHFAEKLKHTTRHSWLANGRQESTAEHVWRMAFLAMLLHPHLTNKPNLDHVLRIILVHDLSEAAVGDVATFSAEREAHGLKEEAAMQEFKEKYNDPITDDIVALWEEYGARQTPEAKFAYICDKLEANIQHNEGLIEKMTEIEWPLFFRCRKLCESDEWLRAFNAAVEKESAARVQEAGKDIDEVIELAKDVMLPPV